MKEGDQRGFTLIELLIVIIIIAILAAIAITQFAASRQRAIEASMVADARNCVAQAEAFFAGNKTYEGFNPAELVGGGRVCPQSPGNVVTAENLTETTYTIRVVNPAATRATRESPLTINQAGVITWAAAPAP